MELYAGNYHATNVQLYALGKKYNKLILIQNLHRAGTSYEWF